MAISLNGIWLVDHLSHEPYKNEEEASFAMPNPLDKNNQTVTPCPVPGYWEDLTDLFRSTPLHTKLKWNPLYTLQRYPQAGYVPDMALPNPVATLVYKKNFTLEAQDIAKENALYIGGAQNTVSAWINGAYLGRHEGYSAEFFFEIPDGLLQAGENRITLAVSNHRLEGYLGRPISGLTSRAACECTGGIYGDVEIRSYPDGLRDVWVSTAEDLSAFTVYAAGGKNKTLKLYEGNKLLCTKEFKGEHLTLSAEGLKKWSPDAPNLYRVAVSTENQTLERRFGIRRLTVRGTKLYLNGEPYFFRGICEHCYHPITVHPTREKNYYRRVLRTLKELGFNSIRFHTYVPMQEYLEAADELGMVIEVETPNNTTQAEWAEIITMCRRYTSVMVYSSGNEMQVDQSYIAHLRGCAELVHTRTDCLFSPISAMRGIEYSLKDCAGKTVSEPFEHNPERLEIISEFCDLYNTYSLGLTSYRSNNGDHRVLDHRNSIYKKPLLSHEICIQGTYIDLGLKDRYRGSRIGETEFMTSVEEHLAEVGLLDRANLYYRNSAAWQQLQRKYCFETLRRCETFAGYDFLGDIDTHWHTFGYCVGMMNEFYELKPGETAENVLRYNSDAVLLADLPHNRNLESGTQLEVPILVSNYGKALNKATLRLRLTDGSKVYFRKELRLTDLPAGEITKLYTAKLTMPRTEKPLGLKLTATLSGGDTDRENTWELFVFPKVKVSKKPGLAVAYEMDRKTLLEAMKAGKKVLLLGAGPFSTLDVSFQLSVAGRTNGHLATVIEDHPLMESFPHKGHCGWQFREMMTQAKAAVLDLRRLPHSPIIDIASTYKNAHREAMLFEYAVGKGKLLVCTLNLRDDDPAARWLTAQMTEYAASESFRPRDAITLEELAELCSGPAIIQSANTNEAQNANDITAKA